MIKKVLYETSYEDFMKKLENSFKDIHDEKYREVIKACYNETLVSYNVFEIVRNIVSAYDLSVTEKNDLSLSFFFGARDIRTNKIKFKHNLGVEFIEGKITCYIEFDCYNDYINGKVENLIDIYISGMNKASAFEDTIKAMIEQEVDSNYKNYTVLKDEANKSEGKTPAEKFEYFFDSFLFYITTTSFADVKENVILNKEVHQVEDSKG